MILEILSDCADLFTDNKNHEENYDQRTAWQIAW